jgi:hypothetical protein
MEHARQSKLKRQSIGCCHPFWRRANLLARSTSDAELEAAMRQSPPLLSKSADNCGPATTAVELASKFPTVRNNVEALSNRFMDRTIPQAVTLLLREKALRFT